jgi:tryprostatin B 6-hydroxylase
MFSSLPAPALTSAFLGIASHVTYFIRAEHLFYPCTFIYFCFLLTPIISFIVLTRFADYSLHEALNVVGVTWWSFTGLLWLSMGVYRTFFHRLGGYPGPFLARLSQLWRVWKNLREENYRGLDKLHEIYGEYARVGTCW